MFGLTLRARMRQCIKILEAKEDSIIIGDDLEEMWADPKTRKALKALEAQEYVNIQSADNRPLYVTMARNGSLYLLTRSEIWKNRIWSFLLGATSTLLAEGAILLIGLLL